MVYYRAFDLQKANQNLDISESGFKTFINSVFSAKKCKKQSTFKALDIKISQNSKFKTKCFSIHQQKQNKKSLKKTSVDNFFQVIKTKSRPNEIDNNF